MTNKLFIGMCAACLIAVSASSAEAAVSKRTVTKAVSLIKQTSNAIGNAIWSNKGSIAVGTAAVAVASKPEILVQPFVQGTE
jgi:hypothetical protein